MGEVAFHQALEGERIIFGLQTWAMLPGELNPEVVRAGHVWLE